MGWSDWGRVGACTLLAAPFVASGVVKAADFTAATAEVRAIAGLEPAAAVALVVIATQLGGSAALIFGGRRVAAGGALALGAFTLLATVLAHDFWAKPEPQRLRDAMIFFEHLAIVGGLALAGVWRRA